MRPFLQSDLKVITLSSKSNNLASITIQKILNKHFTQLEVI